MNSSSPRDADPATGEMRKRILGAAFQAFTAGGYAGTTTSVIAARAKVSKRDLYAMFENKQAMLIACIEGRTASMRVAGGLPAPRERSDLASTLTAFTTNLLTESTHPAVIAMFRLASAEADRSPEVARALDDCSKASRMTLTEFLGKAQSAGLLPPTDVAAMASQCLALAWRDLMMGLLLGVRERPANAEIHASATEAVAAFLQIHPPPAGRRRTP